MGNILSASGPARLSTPDKCFRFIVIHIIFLVWILKTLVLQEGELCLARSTTMFRAIGTSTSRVSANRSGTVSLSMSRFAVSSSLGFNLLGPFLHHFFGREANDEVLDAGVALPEDLTRV